MAWLILIVVTLAAFAVLVSVCILAALDVIEQIGRDE